MPYTPTAASVVVAPLALVAGCALDGIALAALSDSAFSRRWPVLSGAMALAVSLAIFSSWAILAIKLSDTGTALIDVVIWEAIAAAVSTSVAGAFLAAMLTRRRASQLPTSH
jgi:hypothetical protein